MSNAEKIALIKKHIELSTEELAAEMHAKVTAYQARIRQKEMRTRREEKLFNRILEVQKAIGEGM